MVNDEVTGDELAAMRRESKQQPRGRGPRTSRAAATRAVTASFRRQLRTSTLRGGLFRRRWTFLRDQDFIANARQDMPRLIAEVERLRSRRRNAAVK